MDIQYAPSLIESAVLLEIRLKEEQGNPGFLKEYHALIDPVYETDSLEERNKAFKLIHQKLFLKWRLGETLEETVREFPIFENAVNHIYIKLASFEGDADVDLLGKKEGRGSKVILIKLLSIYFTEKDLLRGFLRHEFMHTSDILNQAFKYEESLSLVSSPKNWVRERYSFLWDIYIEGRLFHLGKESMKEKDKLLEELDHLYQKFPEPHRKIIFEWFWNAEGLTHRDLLEMAQDMSKLIERIGISYSGKDRMGDGATIPGIPCPLCHFPTYYWGDDLSAKLREPVIKIIRENHPLWAVEDGACSRCVECYIMLAE